MQATFLSTYDRIKIEGKVEGKLEQALLVAEKILLQFPDWSDVKIADLSDAPLKEVIKICLRLAKKKQPVRKSKPAVKNDKKK